jgi:nitrogen-specific signal transduction histidine kinase
VSLFCGGFRLEPALAGLGGKPPGSSDSRHSLQKQVHKDILFLIRYAMKEFMRILTMSKPGSSDIGGLAIQILNIIEDPISIKNDRLQYIFVNDAFCALYNKSREAFLGMSLSEIFHDAPAESAENQEKTIIETGVEQTGKLDMVDTHGNPCTLVTKRIRLANRVDGPYILCIMKNTDEEHPAQTQKPQIISKSQVPIERRAIHDLKNSLNVVRGYSELLLEDLVADDPSRKDIEAIYQAGQNAVDIASKL